jgi:hypothetical protein
LPRATGVRWPADRRPVLEFLREVARRVPPDEPIFVTESPFEDLENNPVMIYWILDRPCPHRFAELHPGVATTEEGQREILESLDRVRWVVVHRRPDAVARERSLLEEAIARDYREVLRSGEYRLLERIDAGEAGR